jgi:5-methylcytosine-specific restriction protein A
VLKAGAENMPTKEDFRAELRAQLRAAELRGASHLDVNSGAVHRQLGGYPGRLHQMPSCCEAMYDEQRAGDVRLPGGAPKGKGVITIRYTLPR